MPDLGREPLDRARHHGKRGEIGGMAIARHDLRGDRLGPKPELFGHVIFDARIDMGEGADRARDGAGSDLVPCREQRSLGAGELGIGVRELEPERGRLGMHAVAAADGQRVLVLERARFQRGKQRIDIGDKHIGGLTS